MGSCWCIAVKDWSKTQPQITVINAGALETTVGPAAGAVVDASYFNS